MRRLFFLVLALSCHRGLDEYYLTYTLYEPMKTQEERCWKLLVMPPYGFMKYPDLPPRAYNILWDRLIIQLDSQKPFSVVCKDTAAIREANRKEAPAWELLPETGTARAVARAFGADAVCMVEIKSIRRGHEANDPELRTYYVVVLKTRIFDAETGELLYDAKTRGEVYEDLAASMVAAVDHMILPFAQEDQ